MYTCRNCGYDGFTDQAVEDAARSEYKITQEEIDNDDVIIKVWCPDCAVGDGQINKVADLDGDPFYWKLVL